ncbi:MAG TPA: SRPBCC family protein [Nocardioidaceae bacterium]|nr:SRPBCC family protein [Nocardioidaceae bacterium]
MSECSRIMRCQPSDVFDVLSDGWTYPLWVVGAARMRDVDPGWPAEGSRLHHSVGVWPLLLHDTTHSMGVEPPHRLRLKARAWPNGEAMVDLRIDPHDRGCVVTIAETVVSGPAALIPSAVEAPLLSWRNTESLRRLSFIAEGRSRS